MRLADQLDCFLRRCVAIRNIDDFEAAEIDPRRLRGGGHLGSRPNQDRDDQLFVPGVDGAG